MITSRLKNILVPVDFSETSLNAIETAIALAKLHDARLQLLHVVDTSFDFILPSDSYVSMHSISENSADILQALAGSIAQKHKITPKTTLAEGFVYTSIVKESLQNNTELIVMGTHGASGYRECFIGSNTYNVIKHSPCAVLTVPPQKKWLQFKKVLFPVRLIAGALARYDFVRNVLSPSNAALEVLGLSYKKNEEEAKVMEGILDEIKDKLQEDNVKANASCLQGRNLVDNILRASDEKSADMIVISSSVDVTNKHFFVGPNTQRIIHQARVPVLSVKRVAVPAVA